MTQALLLLLYLGVPALLVWLQEKFSVIQKVGAVTLSYIVGILVGNLPGIHIDEHVAHEVMGPAVALSIPLLLFTTDIREFRRSGPAVLRSFGLCVVSVLAATLLCTWFFDGKLDGPSAHYGAMAFGVYTGGTVNLSAIGLGLGVDEEVIVLVNAADLLWGGLLLVFLLTVAKRVYRFLIGVNNNVAKQNESSSSMLDERLYFRGSAINLGIAVLIMAASAGLSYLLLGKISEIAIYLLVTAFGLIVSTQPKLRNIKGSYGLGNYMLCVFCVAVGSLANIQSMLETGGQVVAFIGATVGISLSLHILFTRLTKGNVDSMIVASTAGLYGPPFIAPVARAIGATHLIPVGISTALIGFAVGTYGGLLLGHVISALLS